MNQIGESLVICEKKSDYWKIQRFEPEKIAGTEDRRTNSRKQTVGFPSEDGIGMNKKKSTYFIKNEMISRNTFLFIGWQ